MARDKLITIRIEGEKRKAFGDLAKSQNTDTASLLYDFINQCLSGKIDIGIVTGKGNRIDKLDNQIGDDRIDKLETATQEIDNRLDTIAKKLNDWIEAIDDRLTDSDQGLSKKITSLEHRLNDLAIQLDSQQIDRIDTDSQLDRQRENPDLLKLQRESSIASPIPTGETSHDEPVTDAIEDLPKVETVSTDSSTEPVTDAIASLPGNGMTSAAAHRFLISKNVKIAPKSLDNWIKNSKIPKSRQGKEAEGYIYIKDKRYYAIE